MSHMLQMCNNVQQVPRQMFDIDNMLKMCYNRTRTFKGVSRFYYYYIPSQIFLTILDHVKHQYTLLHLCHTYLTVT